MLLIDKFSGKPVYEQLIEGIERDILVGVFALGAQLPSLREMSTMLSVNPNTIQKSYAELTRRGIIQPAQGSGYYVSPRAMGILREQAEARLETLRTLAGELRLAGVSQEEIEQAVRESKQPPSTNKERGGQDE